MTHDVLMIRSLFASGSEFVEPRQRNTESEPTLTHPLPRGGSNLITQYCSFDFQPRIDALQQLVDVKGLGKYFETAGGTRVSFYFRRNESANHKNGSV